MGRHAILWILEVTCLRHHIGKANGPADVVINQKKFSITAKKRQLACHEPGDVAYHKIGRKVCVLCHQPGDDSLNAGAFGVNGNYHFLGPRSCATKTGMMRNHGMRSIRHCSSIPSSEVSTFPTSDCRPVFTSCSWRVSSNWQPSKLSSSVLPCHRLQLHSYGTNPWFQHCLPAIDYNAS